ncbi:MAG: pirin family protein [Burkholderiaceae bacterium]
MGIAVRLSGHEKDLGGGFTVRRLLPAANQRAVGPFVFFDHFGPVAEQPGHGHDVRPHPHIGLATVTYLFEGAMMHRDSLGVVQRIEPGAINWMTAGSGIVHSERKPEDLLDKAFTNHGLQLWVGLPAEHEEEAPSFSHTAAAEIPEADVEDAKVRVLVGEAFGLRSPVRTYSHTLYLDIRLPAGGKLTLPSLAKEMALYPVEGSLHLGGEVVAERTMATLAPGAPVELRAEGPVRLAVVGGDPLGHRFMWWNFVSSRKERIEQAAKDWDAGRFAPVPGETEFIPLPPSPAVAPGKGTVPG